MSLLVPDKPFVTSITSPALPPLQNGDHLSRVEFERRYLLHSEITHAELIEGVVHVSSPLRVKQHGEPHARIMTWLGTFVSHTPSLTFADNTTVRLDFENEAQPDALVRLEPKQGGKSRVSADDYIEGPPELIVEIAASSAAYDLHDKLRVYQRNGVQEYLAVQVYEKRVDWFALREGVFMLLSADENGILRSEVLPGLWLQPAHFWSGDLAALLAILQKGIASPEHAAFLARLKELGERKNPMG